MHMANSWQLWMPQRCPSRTCSSRLARLAAPAHDAVADAAVVDVLAANVAGGL